MMELELFKDFNFLRMFEGVVETKRLFFGFACMSYALGALVNTTNFV